MAFLGAHSAEGTAAINCLLLPPYIDATARQAFGSVPSVSLSRTAILRAAAAAGPEQARRMAVPPAAGIEPTGVESPSVPQSAALTARILPRFMVVPLSSVELGGAQPPRQSPARRREASRYG